MEATTVIRKPLITEKSTDHIEENRYVFEVDTRARKGEIARAVAELYNVRIVGVSTLRRRGKMRRTRFGYSKTSDTKRAIVKVHPEDKIELF